MDSGTEEKKHPFNSQRIYTAFDRALIEAKTSDRFVDFDMAMPVQDEKGDEHTHVVGKVISVDVYNVEIEWELLTTQESCRNTIWLAKSAMIGVSVRN